MGWIGVLMGFLGVPLVNGGTDRGFDGFLGVLWGLWGFTRVLGFIGVSRDL